MNLAGQVMPTVSPFSKMVDVSCCKNKLKTLLIKYSNTLFTHHSSLITIFALCQNRKDTPLLQPCLMPTDLYILVTWLGAYIAADIYARYLRLQGKDVIFVCGSDEHGAAITIKAKKENTTPKEIVDKYHAYHHPKKF
jgi:hypothetical protein